MSGRAEAAGDMVIIRGKIAARYDPAVEAEVLEWFRQLINLQIPPGMSSVEKNLRDGHQLVRLAKVIQKKSARCPEPARKMGLKPNTGTAPFKQMENIQMFLTFCENYGVPKTSHFQTVDLYEGRNMAQVLSCIQALGSECQRVGFDGPVIGPKPMETNKREFSEEQLRKGQTIIGLQAGSNKFASQSGMSIGGVRHVADIRADNMSQEGHGIIGLQAGTNKYASQAGMRMGGVRHVGDIKSEEMSKDAHGVIGLQAGSNKFASQSGMVMGGVRHVSDLRVDEMSKEGQSMIGLQAGTNRLASQAGMCFGAVRHVADIRADDLSKEGMSVIGLQMGTNRLASQAGMSFGGVRHVADIRADDLSKEGMSVIGLQMGTNRLASQTGMSFGGQRHVADIRADDVSNAGQSVIGLQMGSNRGATQSGMTFGGLRPVADVRAEELDSYGSRPASRPGSAMQYKSTNPGLSFGSRGMSDFDQNYYYNGSYGTNY